MGLSFKPDTDDMRFAPSVDIIDAFVKEGAALSVYDPAATHEAERIFKYWKQIKFVKNPYQAAKDCDCLCLLTEWKEFERLDFKKIKKMMKYPLIADGRNAFDSEELAKQGFEYIGIGR